MIIVMILIIDANKAPRFIPIKRTLPPKESAVRAEYSLYIGKHGFPDLHPECDATLDVGRVENRRCGCSLPVAVWLAFGLPPQSGLALTLQAEKYQRLGIEVDSFDGEQSRARGCES
jgi:hypothetical protein